MVLLLFRLLLLLLSLLLILLLLTLLLILLLFIHTYSVVLSIAPKVVLCLGDRVVLVVVLSVSLVNAPVSSLYPLFSAISWLDSARLV